MKNVNIQSMRAAVKDLQKAMKAYEEAENAQMKATCCTDYNFQKSLMFDASIDMQHALETAVHELAIIQSCDTDVIKCNQTLKIEVETLNGEVVKTPAVA